MRESIIIIIVCALAVSGVNAQNPQWDVKDKKWESFEDYYAVEDTAYNEIVYAHAVIDPVLNKKSVVREILAIGKDSKSIYLKYATFQFDSLSNALKGESRSFNDFMNFSDKFDDDPYRNSSIPGRLLNDFKEGRLKMHGIIFGQSYLYEEPIEEMDWTMQEGSREILGYECSKATLSWRGRDWTAWYTPEIPYSEGPWKFHGLPGLILRLEDATGEHKYQAIGFKNDRYPFGFLRKINPIKTSRKRFEEALKDHKLNTAKRLADSGMADITPEEKRAMQNRRLFYSPIELE